MPETRFTRVDDLDIAYQVVGPAAELDVVFVPGWVSHLEVMWELPEFAYFLDRLAAMGRLILFDKRGTGLSDRVAGTPTLEQRADDIAGVIDAAGSTRAAIAAWGEGAAIAAMFAATHPGRVAALVLGSLPILPAIQARTLIVYRAGLHTGEVERRGTAATGLAVHVGARVAGLARAGEVLVTNTMHTLVLGSGIGFADRGLYTLKGVPDQWQLFAVEHA
jgi:pimeloyl-ACP methyl ester carboxylesterase